MSSLFPLPSPHRGVFGPQLQDDESCLPNLDNISRYPPARVGRVCDFSNATQERFRVLNLKAEEQGRKIWNVNPGAVKDGYELVDSKPGKKETHGKSTGFKAGGKGGNRFQNTQQSIRQQLQSSNYQEGIVGKYKAQTKDDNSHAQKGKGQGKNGKKGKGKHRRHQIQTFRDWSISIRNDWEVVNEMSLAGFTKLNMDARQVTKTDMMWCGSLRQLNNEWDRVSFRKPKTLPIAADVAFFNVTTSQDEIMAALMQDNEELQVFATDHILACLMSAGRSVYSWDIIVRKMDDKIIFDKRDCSPIDFLSVNETSTEPPISDDKENMNSPPKLAKEASRVNQNFAQCCVDYSKQAQELEANNPFEDVNEMEAAATCYRYRKIVLPGNKKAEHSIKQQDVVMCVRTEINGAVGGDLTNYKEDSADVNFVSLKCLNQFENPKKANSNEATKSAVQLNWSTHLETNPGAVLANELKGNAFKIARWVAQAQLSGSHSIKLGWAIRHPNNPTGHAHQLIHCQNQPTAQLSSQISLSEGNGYGILRHLIDLIRQQPDGEYIFVKDPTKPVLRLYNVPDGAFESDEEAEEEEEKSDEDEM